MEPQAFGDKHTLKKLEAVEEYLGMFTTALRDKFELLYIDACAGSGSSMPRSAKEKEQVENGQIQLLEPAAELADTDEIIVGSALRALGVKYPFNRYLFNDKKRKNVEALRREVKTKFSHLEDRVTITQFDANEMLLRICDTINWRNSRAVVFLDPFGLQIKFDTLQALARTQAVDVWYLVPVFAMFRQVRGDGAVLADGGRSVDEALGTTEWRNVLPVEEKGQMDMFGQKLSEKAVDVAWFEKIAQERLKAAFGGRVVEQVLPLGKPGLHEFSLMFAWANPHTSARLASKFASVVLK
ncbi:three-Cys-motif partner protein TcmP [Aurantiacibacter zhengii]|nr:three-Cys-motif partner protein TcmP [Aurantiacibacter zhengii]